LSGCLGYRITSRLFFDICRSSGNINCASQSRLFIAIDTVERMDKKLAVCDAALIGGCVFLDNITGLQ